MIFDNKKKTMLLFRSHRQAEKIKKLKIPVIQIPMLPVIGVGTDPWI